MLASVDPSQSPVAGTRLFSWIAAAAAAAAAILYGPLLIGLARQWVNDGDAAYGAVVAVAAAFVFRERWRRVRALPLTGSPAALIFVLASALLYFAGTLAADVFLVRLSLPALAASAIWFVAGSTHLRKLAAPLALCVVAIPIPDALVTEATLPLQLVASRSAAALVSAAGVPVVRDGNVLALGSVTLEVAQACSGMRSLVTLLALVAVYAAFRELPLRRTALLALATVPVALTGNSLRVAATALLATTSLGANAARGLTHDLTGWAAFVLMCALLAALTGVRPGSDRGQSAVARRLNLPGRTT